MLRLSSLGGRLSTFGFSAAVHAVVLFSWTGHGPLPTIPGDNIEVQLESVPTADPVELDTTVIHRDTPCPPHTHPYPVSPDHDAVPHDPRLVHLPPLRPDRAAAGADVAAQAPQVQTTEGDMPRFTIVVGTSSADTYGAVSAAGTATPRSEVTGPLDERTVDTRASLMQGVWPAYPEEARGAHVEADVSLELVVSAQGVVESARIVRAVGHGFDGSALDAARRFRFAPAKKDGRAVPVRMAWTVQFRIQ